MPARRDRVSGDLLSLRRSALLGVVVVLGLAVVTLSFPPVSGETVAVFASTLACILVVLGLLGTSRRSRGADRRWRLILGIAMIPTAIASAWHARWVYEHGSVLAESFPLSADAFLVTIPLVLAGVLAFPTDPLEPPGPEFGLMHEGFHWFTIIALDSLVIVGSVFVLAWSLILEPALRLRHIDPSVVVAVVGVTAGYLIVLTAVLLLFMFRQPRSGLALALLGAGVCVQVLSTAVYLVIITRDAQALAPLADIVATAGWLLILLACQVRVPGPRGPRRHSGPRTLWLHAALPYLALGATGVLVAAQFVVDGSLGRIERVALICLLIVVLVRQMVTLGENARLLASVQANRQELRHQAFHDPLTGLANRALFANRLEHALHFRHGRPLALAFCDLDDFKRVNDTLGHAAGDALLQTTAARLRAGVRAGDTVARLGGDEFAVLLEDGHDDPETVCRRLAATVRAPSTLAGQPRAIGASLGLVIADPGQVPDAETLLREADLAMYAAKRQGKGGLVVYRADLSTPESAPQTRADLDRVLQGDERCGLLVVRYRPVVDLTTGVTSALDALPYWNHRVLGEIGPDRLHSIADEAGLTVALLGLVLRRVCADLAGLRAGDGERTPVFVRVPLGRGLEQTQVAEVREMLAGHGLPARSIVLALADSRGRADEDTAVPVLRRAAQQGVRLAVDGVGGDASIFALWRVLPVAIVRLEDFLTHPDTADDPGRVRLLRDAVLAAAARLDLTVVATGVADSEQASDLAAAGCQLGTGPLYGPPQPLGDLPPVIPPPASPGRGRRAWWRRRGARQGQNRPGARPRADAGACGRRSRAL